MNYKSSLNKLSKEYVIPCLNYDSSGCNHPIRMNIQNITKVSDTRSLQPSVTDLNYNYGDNEDDNEDETEGTDNINENPIRISPRLKGHYPILDGTASSNPELFEEKKASIINNEIHILHSEETELAVLLSSQARHMVIPIPC